MAKRRIRAQDYQRAIRGATRKLRSVLKDAALEAAQQATGELVAKTDDHELVDKSQYRQGWGVKRTRRGARVGNDAPHARAIEYGRRPNRPGPPLAPIREWVVRKINPDPRELERIARAIREHIHRNGSPPKLIFTSYQPRLKQLFRQAVRRELDKRLRRKGPR